MDLEHSRGQMETYILENTNMEKWKDKEHSLFLMVKNMWEDSKRIKKMGMEYLLCLMEISMMGNGRMKILMEKEHSLFLVDTNM